MSHNVFVLNSSGGQGKDTFSDCCAEVTRVWHISTVDKVKEAAVILGWDKTKKTERDRKFMSDIKQLSIEYNDQPYEYTKAMIRSFGLLESDSIMFIDCREPEEIQRLVDIGCRSILLTNDNVPMITSNTADGRVLEFVYDITIDNSGTLDELRDKAHAFVHSVLAYC